VNDLVYETTHFTPGRMPAGRPSPPLLEQVAAAASAGFGGFFIDAPSLRLHVANGGSVNEVAHWIREAGLSCAGVGSLRIDGNDGIAVAVRALLSEIATLKPRVLLTVCFAEPTDSILAALRSAAGEFAEHGTRLAIEFMPFCPVSDLQAGDRFAQQIGHGAGVCLDSWHFFRGYADWGALEELPPERLAYIQFDDALPLISDDIFKETVERRAFPGEGEFDLHRFADTVRGTGYSGAVGIEIFCQEIREMDCVSAARRLYGTSAPYWRHRTA
jgi:sugar phosphate isomerase/epimerase